MELLQGETLAGRLEHELLPVDLAIGYAVDIAKALAAAHAQSVIHGDLKPSNLIITNVGIKLLDFGLAKRSVTRTSNISTTTALAEIVDIMAGTLPYMSPEQIQQRRVDARSDIFSFGVTLYQMLSGQRPFTASFSAALMAEILQCEPRNILELRPEVPTAIGSILKRCLQKSPDRRWQTAAEVESALNRCKVGIPARRRKAPQRRPFRLRSIAVLPFESVADDEFLADGISESLAIGLGRGGALPVVARSSTARYKGSPKPHTEIGNELGVHGVIAGSVTRPRGRDRVRVALQLTDVRFGSVRWASRFDRHITTLSDARDIADAILSELNVRLNVSMSKRRRTRQIGLEAQEWYLRGRHYLIARTPQSLRQSYPYLIRCLQLEPEFAPAHIAVAQWYLAAMVDRLVPPSEAIPKAKAAALEALRNDVRSAEAHGALGYIGLFEWDVHHAMADFRTAVELDRNNSEAFRHWSRACLFMEEYRNAFELIRIAQRLDPMSPQHYVSGASVALGAGDWDLAIRECHKAIELGRQSAFGYYELGLAEHFRGLRDSAMEHMRSAIQLSGRHPSTLVGLAVLIAHDDPSSSALGELLNELRDDATRAEATPYDFAEYYAAVGDVERAIAYLKRGVELRLPEMVGIRVEPVLRNLEITLISVVCWMQSA